MTRKKKMMKRSGMREKRRVGTCVECGVYLKTKQRRYLGKVCAGAVCRTCSGQQTIKKKDKPGFLASAKNKLLSFLSKKWDRTRYHERNMRERKDSTNDSECSIIHKKLVEIDVYYLGGAHTSMEIFDGCTIHELSQALYPGLDVGLYEVKVDIGEPLGHKLLPSEMTIRNLLKRRVRLGWTQAKVVVPLYRQGGPPHSLMHTPKSCQTVTHSAENQMLTVMDQIKELAQFGSLDDIRIPSPPALVCMDINTTPGYLRITDSPEADESDWESTGSAIRDKNESNQADLSFITRLYSYSNDTSDSDNPPTGPTTTTHAASKKRARNVLNDSCASFSLDWCNSVATNTDFVSSKSQGTMVDTVMTGPRMCAAATNTDNVELNESHNNSGKPGTPLKVHQSVDSATNTEPCVVRAETDMCDTSTNTSDIELEENENANAKPGAKHGTKVRKPADIRSANNTDAVECAEMETNTDACVVRAVTDMCDSSTSTETRRFADIMTNTTNTELCDMNTNTASLSYGNISTNTDACVVHTISNLRDMDSNTDTRLYAETTTNTDACTVRATTQQCDNSANTNIGTRLYTDTSTNTDVAESMNVPHLATHCATCGASCATCNTPHDTKPPLPPLPLPPPLPARDTPMDPATVDAPKPAVCVFPVSPDTAERIDTTTVGHAVDPNEVDEAPEWSTSSAATGSATATATATATTTATSTTTANGCNAHSDFNNTVTTTSDTKNTITVSVAPCASTTATSHNNIDCATTPSIITHSTTPVVTTSSTTTSSTIASTATTISLHHSTTHCTAGTATSSISTPGVTAAVNSSSSSSSAASTESTTVNANSVNTTASVPSTLHCATRTAVNTSSVNTAATSHHNATTTASVTTTKSSKSGTTSVSHTNTHSSATTATNTKIMQHSVTIPYNASRIANFTTAWTMPQEDVNLVTQAKQWLSFALHVNGTANHLTWLQRPPWQVTEVSVSGSFCAFVCTPCDLSNGTVLRPMCMSTFPIQLGCCYKWTGTNLVIDSFSSCDASSVKLTNNSNQPWTFGLTKLDPKTQQQQPICADMVLQKQPVVYTPVLTMYAKVGRTYKTSSVIADIGSWVKFDITRVNSTYQYDHDTSAWVEAAL